MFRIAKIDAFAVVLPLTSPVKPSRIAIPHCDNIIVRIVDDGGRIGWDCNIANRYLVDDVVRNPVAVVDGYIVTPEGPGLGIDVDEDKPARYRRA